MTILIDKEIIKTIEENNMVKPFSISNVGPSSYDVRISNKFFVYEDEVLRIDTEPKGKLIEYDTAILIPSWYNKKYFEDKYPNHIIIDKPVLSSTMEYIKLPSDICAIYTGRSSWGRKFVDTHKTAGYIDNGFHGTITLEITPFYPVEIKAGIRIGQLIFFKTNKPIVDYSQKIDAKYNGQILPTTTKANLDESNIVIYVDGSCNKNPGTIGIAGVLINDTYYCYKYEGKKLTNNIMECLAIYHGLEHIKNNYKNKKITIVSDSLTIIKALRNEINVKAEPLKYFVEHTRDIYNNYNINLIHRKGHTKYDRIGKLISSVMKRYNQNIEPILSENVKIINCGKIEEKIKDMRS